MKYQKGDLVKVRNVSGLYLVISIKKDTHQNDCYECYVISTPYDFEEIGGKVLKYGTYVDRWFDKVG